MSNNLLTFNGIDVYNGNYLLPPMQLENFAPLVMGVPRDDESKARVNQLKAWLNSRQQPHLGVVAVVDPLNLAETGWGVIFPFGPTLPSKRLSAHCWSTAAS